MIAVVIVLDEEGILKSCHVAGHAGFGAKGEDIVCASVSVLVRTAVRVLSGREGIQVQAGAPQRGSCWIEIEHTAEGKDFLYAVGEFLLEGLESVSAEYPKHCQVNIKNGAEEVIWLEKEAVQAQKTDGIQTRNISALRHSAELL